ncbi:MAG: hypothetical protein LWW85_00695 [Marinilabiliales bacterium]|nr:hypothetical protein [Marinilabiliales bacterium]
MMPRKNSISRLFRILKNTFPPDLLTGMAFFFLMVCPAASAQVRLPRMISNGMVLQRETPLKIWGWAAPGEAVTVRFNSFSSQVITSGDGKWMVGMPPQKAGGPFTMEIEASNKVTLHNILVGDVWLCSGQSNIEYPMNRLTDRYAREIDRCENDQIRQFKVPLAYDFNHEAEDYPSGEWNAVNPKTILNFSAVAYFFARELFEKYPVPIGILNVTIGGSPAESWMSREALHDFPGYLAEADKFKDPAYIRNILGKERKINQDWYTQLNLTDKGLLERPTWKDPACNTTDWPLMNIPSYWADDGLGPVNGAVWFRKEIDLPATMAGKPARLLMGRIVDADSVFLNGRCVGTTAYQYPQRRYDVPSGLLQAGKNSLAVRVISNSGKGGFVSDKPYQLMVGNDTIRLNGAWHYRLGCTMPPLPGQTFIQWKPTALYHGMIAPSLHYAIRGVVWYQGESNVERSSEYRKLLTSLLTDWRLKRHQGNFPFLIAQLPNYLEPAAFQPESQWAIFRNEQFSVAKTQPNCALTVNIDLGDWNDIHPQNKEEVGKRLAWAAEKVAFRDHTIRASGPVFKSIKRHGHKIEILFTEVGSGLRSKDGKPLKTFAIAGSEGKFFPAEATICGNRVMVECAAVPSPVVVAYGWADNPAGANLCNAEGLPAMPFRSDLTQ